MPPEATEGATAPTTTPARDDQGRFAPTQTTETTAVAPAAQNNEANMWRRKAEENAAKLAALEAREAERAQADMTEAQKATARADAAESRAKALEHENLIRKVAAEEGLPSDAVDLLSGNDEAEIRAKAGKVKTLIGSGAPAAPAPVTAGTATRPATTPAQTYDERIIAAQKSGNMGEEIRLIREKEYAPK